MSDSGSDAGGTGDAAWDDWNEEVVSVTKDILYHDMEHSSPDACIKHCASEYGWDLRALAKALDFDIYHSIRMVNWMRREVANNRSNMDDAALLKHLQQPFSAGARPGLLDDDSMLHPFLPDDSLLDALSLETWEDSDLMEDGETLSELDMLKRENAQLKQVIEAAKAAMLDSAGDGDEPSTTGQQQWQQELQQEPSGRMAPEELAKDEENRKADRAWDKMTSGDKGYFNSYARFGIHYDMLSDKVRTEGYQKFLLNNPSLLKGKTVLDIGCGTGILSMMAAKAGAKRVIGIDMSEIIFDAEKIVAENGYSDVITLIRGKCEEVELPADVGKVDVVISEWMGYMLLYESMLDSVIYARDKWMAPDGVCMPHKCTMLIAGMQDDRLNFWDDVYGFSMKRIKDKISQTAHYEPVVEHFDGAAHIVTNHCVLREVDCQHCSVADLVFDAEFTVTTEKDCTIVGLLNWFDTFFELKCDLPSSFSTGPMTTETHWKQSAFYLSRPVECVAGDSIQGVVHLARHVRNHRHLEIVIEWQYVSKSGDRGNKVFQNFEFV